jgi:hypothetical protein
MGEMDEGISGFTEENSGSHFDLWRCGRRSENGRGSVTRGKRGNRRRLGKALTGGSHLSVVKKK